MIDTAKAKWTLSKADQYAIKWLNEHGFSGELKKQYLSKNVYLVSKDNITQEFELMSGQTDIAKYMEVFEKGWNLIIERNELRAQLNARKESNDKN